ncbi:MAG: hypothetical protein HC848_08815, partial [Limnobacter sp.]|nr:hypothetical protein [Limnobacter sp.]
MSEAPTAQLVVQPSQKAKLPTAWAVTFVLVLAVLESAMIWWRITAAPLAWICLVWLLVAVVLVAKSKRPAGRLLWLNLGAVLLAVGGVEGALYVNKHNNPYIMPPGVRFVGDMARPNYFIEMPVTGLGYRPRPGLHIQATKMQHNAALYSVHYTVAPDGLRISPRSSADVRACVFMFGDSVAWGEGVEDEQTAAWQIGLNTQGRVKVSNFAFTGYSAHQMLWQASTGMVAARSGCSASLPVLAIYQTLPNNVARVAGLRGW